MATKRTFQAGDILDPGTWIEGSTDPAVLPSAADQAYIDHECTLLSGTATAGTWHIGQAEGNVGERLTIGGGNVACNLAGHLSIYKYGRLLLGQGAGNVAAGKNIQIVPSDGYTPDPYLTYIVASDGTWTLGTFNIASNGNAGQSMMSVEGTADVTIPAAVGVTDNGSSAALTVVDLSGNGKLRVLGHINAADCSGAVSAYGVGVKMSSGFPELFFHGNIVGGAGMNTYPGADGVVFNCGKVHAVGSGSIYGGLGASISDNGTGVGGHGINGTGVTNHTPYSELNLGQKAIVGGNGGQGADDSPYIPGAAGGYGIVCDATYTKVNYGTAWPFPICRGGNGGAGGAGNSSDGGAGGAGGHAIYLITQHANNKDNLYLGDFRAGGFGSTGSSYDPVYGPYGGSGGMYGYGFYVAAGTSPTKPVKLGSVGVPCDSASSPQAQPAPVASGHFSIYGSIWYGFAGQTIVYTESEIELALGDPTARVVWLINSPQVVANMTLSDKTVLVAGQLCMIQNSSYGLTKNANTKIKLTATGAHAFVSLFNAADIPIVRDFSAGSVLRFQS